MAIRRDPDSRPILTSPFGWPFDQPPNAACITTRQVLEEGHPILRVVHYSDDHSWAFLCGTTNADQDGRVIAIQEAFELDPTIREISNLAPGWTAWRDCVGGAWQSAFSEPY